MLVNKHRGQKAIVCGTGPSLGKLADRSIEPSVISIVCNDAIDVVPDAAYFHCSDCRTLVRPFWNTLRHAVAHVVLPRIERDAAHRGHNYWFVDHIHDLKISDQRLVWYNVGRSDSTALTTPEYPVPYHYDSALAGVAIAHVLGCSPIFVLGVDLCIKEDKGHYYDDAAMLKLLGKVPTSMSAWREEENRLWLRAADRWRDIMAANPCIDIRDLSDGRLTQSGICPAGNARDVLS